MKMGRPLTHSRPELGAYDLVSFSKCELSFQKFGNSWLNLSYVTIITEVNMKYGLVLPGWTEQPF